MQKIQFPLLLVLLIANLSGAAGAHEAPKTSREKLDYIQNHINLFEIETTRIDTYSKKAIPAVKFAIKNLGQETLTKVEVVVYFLDKNDQPFFEKSFLPVLVSKYSSHDNTPLKPNYTYRMKANRYYTIETLGDEWSGEATFEITDIEFAE